MVSGKDKIKPGYLFFCLLLLALSGCNKDGDDREDSGEAMLSLFVNAASDSINEDNELWEDRVDELRMIVFDAGSKQVVFNQKLAFPNGFNGRSRPVPLPLGTFDFYFIANETVYNGNFVNALMEIQNASGFDTDSRFTTLAYDPAFTPDGTTSAGRFVMSAIYRNIAVVAGGTESNPALLAIPNGRVELIRDMAKVEVIFRKTTPGSTVPENTITSVLLEQVASYISVPPMDDYYTGPQTSTPTASLNSFDYEQDSIGAVRFYIPEFLIQAGSTNYTLLHINNSNWPIENDDNIEGLQAQRRSIANLSLNSVVRNYHYVINAYIDGEGGVQLRTYVNPWLTSNYRYIFQGGQQIVLPPVEPTDSSIIIPTECGRVEILSHNENLQQGLMGAYNDEIVYYDPQTGQSNFIRQGDPPYHCEKKYGPGWRLINSCELMSFLAVVDTTYTIWLSNTWLAQNSGKTFYPLKFRQAAQVLLEELTGYDLSGSVLYAENNWADAPADEKLGIVDQYFTPGDILVRPDDFPGGWPYAAPPGTPETWIYSEATIQVKAFWYQEGYLSPAVRSNWDKILYNEFERFDYSSTVSRCVRSVE